METFFKKKWTQIDSRHSQIRYLETLIDSIHVEKGNIFFKQEQTIVTTDSGHRQDLISKNEYR